MAITAKEIANIMVKDIQAKGGVASLMQLRQELESPAAEKTVKKLEGIYTGKDKPYQPHQDVRPYMTNENDYQYVYTQFLVEELLPQVIAALASAP